MPDVRRLAQLRRPLLVLLSLGVLLVGGYLAQALKSDSPAPSPARTAASVSAAPSDGRTALSTLPVQAQQTYELIAAGGPYPYDRDGIVFGNREGLLPRQKSGYYHEFTVPTPGEGDRGARRLITGSKGELYYTGDHYESFVRVDPDR